MLTLYLVDLGLAVFLDRLVLLLELVDLGLLCLVGHGSLDDLLGFIDRNA
jgi:hypothetical protein